MDDKELQTKVRNLSDEKLLDLAACNWATSHPPVTGFPDQFITERSSPMAELLLTRIEKRDDDGFAIIYMSILEDMADKNPGILPVAKRESALRKCLAIFPPFTDLQGKVHHYCTAFGGQ